MNGNTNNRKTIGTHSGKFHCDEVVGCVLLKSLPEYKDAQIIRSRDPKVLEKCDIVIDVGAVYDHSKKRYDHHQREFTETLRTVVGVEGDIKLSSAGLVWAHYGKDIVKELSNHSLHVGDLHLIYCQMYDVFIKEIDARDNGIDAADPPFRYKVHTDISSRIARLNPNPFFDKLDEETQFQRAMDLAKKELAEIFNNIVGQWLPSRAMVSIAVDGRFDVDESGQIIALHTSGILWPPHLKVLEKEKRILPFILFVLFPDSASGWRVQAVSKDGGFVTRHAVLPRFQGLRDDELREACGITDAIFVHASGFIGGAKTYEGVLKMAQMTINGQAALPPPFLEP